MNTDPITTHTIKSNKPYTSLQLVALVVLRFFIGWHLLFEGLSKLFNPNWSSVGFLSESQWIMADFAHWIISNATVLVAVDFLNTWGLIAIGISLILGLFGRIAAIAGCFLLLLYYLNTPPLIGLYYSVPQEGNNLIINKTLIEAVALFVLAVFPTSHLVGLDLFVEKIKHRNHKQQQGNDK